MKKTIQAVCLAAIIGLAAAGCGGQSVLTGKAVDGKGNPIAGMKIIAKQDQPVKGYENLETTTGPDGAFTFKGLYPSASYTLSPAKENTRFSASITVQSSPDGQTSAMPNAFLIRFSQGADNIITDSATGLRWLPDPPDKDIAWDEAQAYVRDLKAGGCSQWRLPARAEVKGLYDPGNPSFKAGYNKLDSLFQLKTCCVWSSELFEPAAAGYFRFFDGLEGKIPRTTSRNLRMLAVCDKR